MKLDLDRLPLHRQLAIERLAHRVTQQRAAMRAGISEIYLSKLETAHRRLTPELAERIRAAIKADAIAIWGVSFYQETDDVDVSTPTVDVR